MRVADALSAYYAAKDMDSRGDEQHLHVADLAKCPREVWARRNGRALLPFSLQTKRKFALGVAVEGEVLAAVEHAYGEDYAIERDALVWLDLDEDSRLIGGHFPLPGQAREAMLSEMLAAHPNRVIGHPDAILRPKREGLKTLVIEVKSTLFFERTGPDGRKGRVADALPMHQYLVQASGYGLATAAAEVIITASCVQSGAFSPETEGYRFAPSRYAGVVTNLIRQQQRLTAIGAPMPPAAPPDYGRRMRPREGQAENWLCDYCRLATCEMNNNPARLEVAL